MDFPNVGGKILSENPALSRKSSEKYRKKLIIQFQVKRLQEWKHGRKEGQTLFYGTRTATTRVKKYSNKKFNIYSFSCLQHFEECKICLFKLNESCYFNTSIHFNTL